MKERLKGQMERKRGINEVDFTTTIRLSEFQKRLIGSMARLEGITQSELIRNALDDFFQKKLSEYEGTEGEKKDLANKVNEITICSRSLEKALDDLI